MANSSDTNFNKSSDALAKLLETKRSDRAELDKFANRKKEAEKLANEIAALEYKLEIENKKKVFEQEKKNAKELSDAKVTHLKSQFKIADAYTETIAQKFKDVWDDSSVLTDKLDTIIKNFVSKQQSVAAHLAGTGTSLNDITNTLSGALSAQGLVKQESVYNNLSKLVNSGIVYNVEQRAFLQTLSDDMNLLFDASNGSLTRLIRLQSTDLTSYRMAIQYDLQKFLNENYATSEYIRDAFTSVSSALLETQSMMTSSEGLALESTLQTILGSYYSLGGSSNTVNSLAQAINALGSGDISNLGSGISNLILMGVAQAGLDYGDILNNGLTANETSSIMNSVISYMSSMYNNSESNVVKNQLAKVFGVSVSDLVAAVKTPKVEGGVSADINNLLSDYSGFTPITTQMSNLMENMWYSWGTNIASNGGAYITYELSKLISSTMGDALTGVTVEPFNIASINLGSVVKAAPLFALIPTLLETVGDVAGSFGSWLSGGFGLSNIFDALSTTSRSTIKMSEAGVSGSLYIGNGNSKDLLNNSLSSVSEIAGINTAGDENTNAWKDDVSVIKDNIIEIYRLLVDISNNMIDMQNNYNRYTGG